MTPGDISCGSCHYCEPAVMDGDKSLVLECHRYPPSTTYDGVGIARLVTQVLEQDWCGEWLPREETGE